MSLRHRSKLHSYNQRYAVYLQFIQEQKGIKIDRFDKTYLYNVKGRNDREVEHLVVYNF